jgi:hypothetical protein
VYCPDWRGLNKSGAVTAGQGVTFGGQPTVQLSLPTSAFMLKLPVPGLRLTSANGGDEIA